MSSIFTPKPFSMFELVAGSAALAPVALIALFGLRVPQSQNALPAAPSNVADSLPLPQSPAPASRVRLSEQSQNAGAAREPDSRSSGSEGDDQSGSEPDTATSAPAEEGSSVAAAWRFGRWRLEDEASVKQRLMETGFLWGLSGEGTQVRDDSPTEPSTQGQVAETQSQVTETQGQVPDAALAPSPMVEQNPPRRDSRSESTFAGGWADDRGECRDGQNHHAPLVINIHAAKTAAGKCDFQSVKREASSRWRVVALCSSEGESWTAHIDLKLAGSNLTWSSERGTTTYVRCLKP